MAFPKGFLWGASSAAYQVEGAYLEDGKKESIWDYFSHEPGRMTHGEYGDIACDHYHHWREDVALMKKIGLKSYRFSIIITENGMAGMDWVSMDGKVHDMQRIDFLHRYLLALGKVIEDGVPVLGYHVYCDPATLMRFLFFLSICQSLRIAT